MKNRLFHCIAAAGCLAAPFAPAQAGEHDAIGEDARRWVDLQKSGEAAERSPDGMPGEIAERVWQRYVESFSYPIPERFEREGFVDSGGN
jgi:Ni/Co efflux regulator RcnB